jgi:aspartate racemase
MSIPLLHIADATAECLVKQQIHKVGLLGTRFTMEQDFYKGRLTERFGIEVIVPTAPQRDLVHRVIYEELCQGHIRDNSREQYIEIINDLYQAGAQAVILGCTEIGLLVGQQDVEVPLFDTTKIHAAAAISKATAAD